MKMKIYLGILFLCLYISLLNAVGPDLQTATIAYYLTDQKGEKIAGQNEEKSMIPASVMKVLTTATALEMLGEGHRFQTIVQYSGVITPEGVLNGNIYIKGGGDPTLGSRYIIEDKHAFMKQWLLAIEKAGIKQVDGSVIADESYFDLEGIPAKWLREDIGNYYAAGIYGLSIYDNMYALYLSSGAAGSKAKVEYTDPEIEKLRLISYAKAVNNQRDSIYIYGEPFNNERRIYGSMPANKASFSVKGDIPDPAFYLADLLTLKLEEKGIKVKGEPLSYRMIVEKGNRSDEKRNELCVTRSPELKKIIDNVNHISNNHYAEYLLKHIGAVHYSQASTGMGVEVLKNYWKSKGLSVDGVRMYDGSGLSPVNAVPPRFLVDVLNKMRISPRYKIFQHSLPVSGKSGTLTNFLKGTPLEGKVYAKSGSIAGVQCYAGYVVWGSENYTFAIMINHFDCSRQKVRREIENILLSVIPQQ